MKKQNIEFVLAGLIALPMMVGSGHALTIVDSVGQESFTLEGVAPLGDGWDEVVSWTFDFTDDPDYAAFQADSTLGSAQLTLSLNPRHHLISTDTIQIQGLPLIDSLVIQALPVGQWSTVQLDLLDFYTADEILGALGIGHGTLPMRYADDAILSGARLGLSASDAPVTFSIATSVPDSSATLSLLVIGLGSLGAMRHFGLRRMLAPPRV